MAPPGGSKRKRSSSHTDAVESHGDTTEEDPDVQEDATDQNIMPLHWDIWYRICELLREDDRGALFKLCLVSKSMNAIAMPHLYHSVVLGPARDRDREEVQPADVEEPGATGQLVIADRSTVLGPAILSPPRSSDPESQSSAVFEDSETPVDRVVPSPGLEHLLALFRNDRKGRLRSMVHILTIQKFDRWDEHHQHFARFVYFGKLGYLIRRLPALTLVVMHGHLPNALDDLPDWLLGDIIPYGPKVPVLTSIRTHPAKPELQLLGESSEERKWTGPALLCLTVMHLKIDNYYFRRHANVTKLCRQPFHCLLFASPNLRTLSIEGPWPESRAAKYVKRIFVPRKNSNFPPIQDLSLNGYYMVDYEWNLWQKRFAWEGLQSLTIGPRPVAGFSGISRLAVFLKHFKMEAFADHEARCLCRYIWAFKSLETLELVNVPCSLFAVMSHHKLVKLCLHQADPWPQERPRQVATAKQLFLLDKYCPDLQILELDLQRKNGGWPRDTFTILARGFKELRSLSLHFDIGVGDLEHVLQPVLNYHWAQRLATYFYRERWINFDAGNPEALGFPSKLQKLILWAGFSIRNNASDNPERAMYEARHSATFMIFPPDSFFHSGDFNHVQRWQLDAIRDPAEQETDDYKELVKRVNNAVLGPKSLMPAS